MTGAYSSITESFKDWKYETARTHMFDIAMFLAGMGMAAYAAFVAYELHYMKRNAPKYLIYYSYIQFGLFIFAWIFAAIMGKSFVLSFLFVLLRFWFSILIAVIFYVINRKYYAEREIYFVN